MLMENKQAYLNNELEKFDYMRRMAESHKILYEYANFINKGNILDICLKDGEVYFSLKGSGSQIKMVCIPYDVTSVPFNFLDFGSYDIEETRFLSKVVEDNFVVLDIGANLGWYTLNWLKSRNNVTVFSFEPLPEIYNRLVKNLELNGLNTKNAFNFGLSNVNEQVDFFFDTERCGASSMVNLRGTNDTINVRCSVKRIDDVFPKLGVKRLDFIKCDVEGAEKLVFAGGIETIKNFKPIIFSEMLRKWSRKFNYHPNDVISLLASIGYHCYVCKGDKLKEIKEITEETVETNFIFLNKNNHNTLKLNS